MALYPSSQPYQWTFRRAMWATLVLVFVAFGFWLLYRFNQVVFILFVAIVIGTVIRPLVTWLHRRGLPGWWGVILVYLLLLALVISHAAVIPGDCRARDNDCRRGAGLLPKPA
ncbi:MAG: AI-2E family transporter [Dehalococcoidia bacterium]|nr:AI-2E family transporter [Dehalococcoidia bacterium]